MEITEKVLFYYRKTHFYYVNGLLIIQGTDTDGQLKPYLLGITFWLLQTVFRGYEKLLDEFNVETTNGPIVEPYEICCKLGLTTTWKRNL